MGLLYMITADPARDATFTMFAKPDYFLSTFPPTTAINPAFTGTTVTSRLRSTPPGPASWART
jgi:hypothetical protein